MTAVNSSPSSDHLKVLLATCGAWYLPHTARSFAERDALAGLWMTMGNSTAVHNYRRCWPFQLAMLPLYRWAPQIWCERAFYALFPLWKSWLRRQQLPKCNVVHAMMGYATELFEMADNVDAFKVIDCPNSHPTTYYGYWQRECDLWCPGENVPIPRWMFTRMNRELERANLVLCPSIFVKDTMIQNGVPATKCFVNPFGVDTNVFRKRVNVPTRPRFISVGAICLRKGHQYLFRAFERVKAAVPEAELICVGPYKSDFARERQKWTGTFQHYLSLSHSELATLLPECTAFVLASVEEGFARVLSEAMAVGLPLVATYETGATTLVTDAIDAFIVPARDPEALAAAMIRIAIEPGIGRKMGEAAFEKGAARNTWQDYGDRLLREYSEHLTGKRNPQKSV